MASNGYKKFADIKEISSDTVFLKDRTVIAVLEITPIDFDRMPESKKQKVLKKYKEWLESLNYPVQIIARNVNMDVEKQAKIMKNKIEHLIKQKMEYRDLLSLFKEFEAWFDKYISANSRARRIYYVVIPYMSAEQPSLFEKFRKSKVKAKHNINLTLLNKRVDECTKKLAETGVRIYRLNTAQLENLYESYFMINNQKGANEKSVYIGPEDWFRMWKDVMEKKEN